MPPTSELICWVCGIWLGFFWGWAFEAGQQAIRERRARAAIHIDRRLQWPM